MYQIGTFFYAIYFYVSFPMFFRYLYHFNSPKYNYFGFILIVRAGSNPPHPPQIGRECWRELGPVQDCHRLLGLSDDCLHLLRLLALGCRQHQQRSARRQDPFYHAIKGAKNSLQMALFDVLVGPVSRLKPFYIYTMYSYYWSFAS